MVVQVFVSQRQRARTLTQQGARRFLHHVTSGLEVDHASGSSLQLENEHSGLRFGYVFYRAHASREGDWRPYVQLRAAQQGARRRAHSILDRAAPPPGSVDAMRPVDDHIKGQLTRGLVDIGKKFDADVVTIVSPIVPGLELSLRKAIEALSERLGSVTVILDTPGGVVEVVERMVTAIRSVYDDVTVIVPDRAMSAGTIFALSADRIMMDRLSCLGPIDPQIEREGKLVPALSYLNQFDRLNYKAQSGELTTAEYALLNKLDLGELYQFEQARELSIDLLIRWLSQYKFKNWIKTETQGQRRNGGNENRTCAGDCGVAQRS